MDCCKCLFAQFEAVSASVVGGWTVRLWPRIARNSSRAVLISGCLLPLLVQLVGVHRNGWFYILSSICRLHGASR